MLVGTHCDMIKDSITGKMDQAEIEARCEHVVRSLKAEEEKDVSQLQYCLLQLMDPSTKKVMCGREAEAAQIEGLLRNRLAMPQKVNPLSFQGAEQHLHAGGWWQWE